MNKEEIVYIKTSELKNNPQNPRKNDNAVDSVAKSIKKYGFRNPLIVDENNIVFCGNTRLKASRSLGIEECPCIVIKDLTKKQMDELALLDNKTNEIADWDFDMLTEQLGELDLEEFDLDWGIDDLDLGEEKEVEEDDYEVEIPEEPKSKLGDIYQLGEHRLMCGDSTKEEDVEQLMDGQKADMVFTDPPYGYNYQSNMRVKTNKFDIIENDDKILNFFPLLKGTVKGFIFICTTWKVLDKWLPLFKDNYNLTNMIIWDKGGGGIGDLEHTFSTDYEIILCSNNDAKITGKRIGSVWDINKDNANSYNHPTQKPVKLSATAIENTTKPNNIVLDLFGGSGSTLIACEQLDRKCYMMEYDTKYVDVIIDRWEQFTGKKAVKIK